jgi:phosphatidylglycerophosphate synthase
LTIKPYKSMAFTFRDIFCEFCFIGIHLTSLLLFFENPNRNLIGIIIVSFCWGILVIHTILTFYQYYLSYKERQK